MADVTRLPVVEWATDEVRVFDPATSKVTKGRSILDAAESVRGQSVVIALSRRSSFVRCTRLPDVPKPEMEKILGLQLAGMFPIEGTEAATDFLPLDDKGPEGRLVLVAAVRTDVLQEALSEAECGGVKVHSVCPVALASLLVEPSGGAVAGPTPEGLAVDVVDRGGVVLSRVVPMPSAASECSAEVSRSFGAANVPPGPVTTFGALTLDGATNTHAEPLELLSSHPFELNIELPEKKAARSESHVKRARNLAVLLWSAALLIGVMVVNFRLEAAQAVAASDAKWSKQLQSLRSVNAKSRAVADKLRAQQDLLEGAFAPKQPLGDVVTVLTNLTPDKLWLTGITVERGKRATLRGTALTSEAVSGYLASLGRQSRVRDVKLVFANNAMLETTPVVNFSISTHVVGNFPIEEAQGRTP